MPYWHIYIFIPKQLSTKISDDYKVNLAIFILISSQPDGDMFFISQQDWFIAFGEVMIAF